VILDAFHFDLKNSEHAEKGVPQPAGNQLIYNI